MRRFTTNMNQSNNNNLAKYFVHPYKLSLPYPIYPIYFNNFAFNCQTPSIDLTGKINNNQTSKH